MPHSTPGNLLEATVTKLQVIVWNWGRGRYSCPHLSPRCRVSILQTAGSDGVPDWGNHSHQSPTFPYCAVLPSPTSPIPTSLLALEPETQHPPPHPLSECALRPSGQTAGAPLYPMPLYLDSPRTLNPSELSPDPTHPSELFPDPAPHLSSPRTLSPHLSSSQTTPPHLSSPRTLFPSI